MEFLEKFRSNLRRIGGRKVKVVLITSTGSSEGKTTSAYNLGIASARARKKNHYYRNRLAIAISL